MMCFLQLGPKFDVHLLDEDLNFPLLEDVKLLPLELALPLGRDTGHFTKFAFSLLTKFFDFGGLYASVLNSLLDLLPISLELLHPSFQ